MFLVTFIFMTNSQGSILNIQIPKSKVQKTAPQPGIVAIGSSKDSLRAMMYHSNDFLCQLKSLVSLPIPTIVRRLQWKPLLSSSTVEALIGMKPTLEK